MSLVYRLFTGLAVYALLLPILGPALDHHFAERLPLHEHLYFGSAAPHHVHLFEVPHVHSAQGQPEQPPPGVLSVAPWEGLVSQQAVALLAGPGPLHLDLHDLGSAFALPGSAPRLPDAPLAPPEQPPRLSASPLA